MQFKRAQRGQLAKTWHGDSWFYKSLGPPARSIIEMAYGLKECTPSLRSRAQDDVTTALSIFARRMGCEKSQVVHALLSGSVKHLMQSIHKHKGSSFSEPALRSHWEGVFREVNTGSIYLEGEDSL